MTSAPIRVSEAVPDPRVRAASSGDRAAASALLTELLPRVRNLARYFMRNDHDADDVAQQALMEILKSLRSYRGEGELTSWADRITARVALAARRRGRTERDRGAELGPALEVVRSGEPDAYLVRRDMVRLLDQLPSEQRDAIVLHHVMGLSAPELAAELGVPFETARSRLRLGTQRLREAMAARDERAEGTAHD